MNRSGTPVRADRAEKDLWLAMNAAAETDGKPLNDAVLALFEEYVERVSTEKAGAFARNLARITEESANLK